MGGIYKLFIQNKMLKHLITIIGCVLCLLAVYVYFVSQDLRKLNADLSKNKTDIQSLVASLSNLYKDISATKKKQRPVVENQQDDFDEISSEDIKKIINEIPSDDDELDQDQNIKCTNDICSIDTTEHIIDETEESPKELSEEDFDDIKLEHDNDPEPTIIEEITQANNNDEDLKLLPIEQLRTYTIPYLKEYCKKNNLSIKGTKEALISRIIILTA